VVIDRDDYSELPMKPVTVKVPNPLPVPAAIERLRGFVGTLQRKYGMEGTEPGPWVGDVMRYEFTGPAGNTFKGYVRAGEETVEVVVESSVFEGGVKGVLARGIAKTNIRSALKEALGS
jgi:hypothetical protein